MAIQIHNCHTHLFTMRHVPKKYYGIAKTLVKPRLVRKPLLWILRNLNPFSDKDKLHRLAAFARIGYSTRQERVFTDHLSQYYPGNTRFIVLPMDMAYMGYGDPPEGVDQQHEELAIMRDKHEEQVIPFVHYDPRRINALEKIAYWIEEQNFKGVKIYPPLGYEPTYPRLMDEIYPYCEANNIPMMTHCSSARVRAKCYEKDKTAATFLGNPDRYDPILKKFPKLRLCLGHFGGDDAWNAYLNDPQLRGEHTCSPTGRWLRKILEKLQAGTFPNLYVDISYVIFQFHESSRILKVLLSDSNVLEHTLFGSDFYMSEQERFSEKQLSMFLRAELGETMFEQIAAKNPKRFLDGPSA